MPRPESFSPFRAAAALQFGLLTRGALQHSLADNDRFLPLLLLAVGRSTIG
jgi:hypothetical protein